MKTLLICAAVVAGLQAIDAFAQLPPGEDRAAASITARNLTVCCRSIWP